MTPLGEEGVAGLSSICKCSHTLTNFCLCFFFFYLLHLLLSLLLQVSLLLSLHLFFFITSISLWEEHTHPFSLMHAYPSSSHLRWSHLCLCLFAPQVNCLNVFQARLRELRSSAVVIHTLTLSLSFCLCISPSLSVSPSLCVCSLPFLSL